MDFALEDWAFTSKLISWFQKGSMFNVYKFPFTVRFASSRFLTNLDFFLYQNHNIQSFFTQFYSCCCSSAILTSNQFVFMLAQLISCFFRRQWRFRKKFHYSFRQQLSEILDLWELLDLQVSVRSIVNKSWCRICKQNLLPVIELLQNFSEPILEKHKTTKQTFLSGHHYQCTYNEC